MDADARARSGGLIDPQVVVDTVLELADDPGSAGRIVIVRAGRRPLRDRSGGVRPARLILEIMLAVSAQPEPLAG